MDGFNWASLVYLLLLLVLIGPIALARGRGRLLPFAALWLAALVALVFLYQTFGPF